MGSVTAACRAGLRRSRQSGVPARTVIPLSTEATVHLVRCCIGRQSGFTLCDGGSCTRVSKNGQGGVMKARKGLLAARAAVLLLSCASPHPPPALAADADMVFKTYDPPPLGMPWWSHGYIEAGARGFLNNPERDGTPAQGGRSLAKYYEYSSIKPGPFLEGWVSAGSKNGLYRVDAWAGNVGYDDQRYQLEASDA